MIKTGRAEWLRMDEQMYLHKRGWSDNQKNNTSSSVIQWQAPVAKSS